MTPPTLHGVVTRLGLHGAGLVTVAGRNYYVDGTAPGDGVVFCVADEKTQRTELLEISSAGTTRVPPACKYYPVCGGCKLQHVAYNVQLEEKRRILEELFRRAGVENVPPVKTVSGAPYEYRNRIELHRDIKSGAIGFKSARSNAIVQIDDCPIAVPVIRRALQERALKAPPELDRFTVYGNGALLLAEGGVERGMVELCGKSVNVDAAVFFQSNAGLLEKLLAEVREAASCATKNAAGKLYACELYCGVGTFALFLEPYFDSITLVEENVRALELAKLNLKNAAPPTAAPSAAQCFFFPLSVEKWLKKSSARNIAYGFIVADPPRAGLSKELSAALCNKASGAFAGASTLAYVSCNPQSLARDAAVLTAGGWKLSALTFFDFYPQTEHIETLALFTK
jgi:23S rRNA (uracil1939-C5)-methyltransferase